MSVWCCFRPHWLRGVAKVRGVRIEERGYFIVNGALRLPDVVYRSEVTVKRRGREGKSAATQHLLVSYAEGRTLNTATAHIVF